MDFYQQMSEHVMTCTECTDYHFCDKANAILEAEYPDMITLPASLLTDQE